MQNDNDKNREDGVVYSYTRAQAIVDGVLVDVSETARECGFKYPVAVTSTVWDRWVVPGLEEGEAGQTESGRLWDVLSVLRVAIYFSNAKEVFSFRVLFLENNTHVETTLKSVCGPGDSGEPVITIMFPGED